MDKGAFYWFADVVKIMGEEKGLKYMKRLAEQLLKFHNGRSINCQLVAAGEISIALPVYNHSVDRIKSQGGPIEWVALEPIVAEINSPSISSHAPIRMPPSCLLILCYPGKVRRL